MSSFTENENTGMNQQTTGNFTGISEEHSESTSTKSTPEEGYGEYKREFSKDGGVCYVQQPPKKNKKGRKVAALAVLIVVCMVMSSFGTSALIAYLYDQGYIFKQSDSSDPIHPSENVSGEGGARGNVIIQKNDPDPTQRIPGQIGTPGMSESQIYALVSDSVVEITTSSVKYNAIYGQYVESGAGSGVIFARAQEETEYYYVVTNYHVINGAETIRVRLKDESEFPGRVIGSDAISDIAVLEICSEKELSCAQLGSSASLAVGDHIVVIGNPLGQLGGSMTDGIVSALNRSVDVEGMEMNLLQISAAINPGNSGGGMFNTAGELVGIVNAKANGREGIGFAIPMDYVFEIIEDLLKEGYVSGRAALPCSVSEYTYTTSLIGETSTYVIVTSVDDNSELKQNDVIYAIDDNRITTMNSLISLLAKYKIGDTVKLQVARPSMRGSKVYTYEVRLIESLPSNT